MNEELYKKLVRLFALEETLEQWGDADAVSTERYGKVYTEVESLISEIKQTEEIKLAMSQV